MSLTRRSFLAAAACATLLRAQEPTLPQATVTVTNTPGSKVPADFLGLSFPAATLNDAAFFHPENIYLVQQIRTIAPHGILRIAGGTTSLSGVDTKVIDNLDTFLKAIGWTCVYGLRTDGNPQAAVKYISDRLGPRLNAFELSSNSDSSPQRALATAKALQAAITGIRFTVEADALAPWQTADKPDLQAISTHYLRGNKSQPDLRAAADSLAAKTVRIAEAGTSQPDIFAAALWSADTALQWMTEGYAAAGFRDGISTKDGRTTLSPVAHGMKFAAPFLGATMLPVTLETASQNVTAHAARRPDGKTILAIFNLEATQPVRITAPFFDTLQVLIAPSLEAHEAHVTHIVSETGSTRTTAGQAFTLPPHTATLLVLR